MECGIRDEETVVHKLTMSQILTNTGANMHNKKTVGSQRRMLKREVTKLVAVLSMKPTVRKATGESTIEHLQGRILDALWENERSAVAAPSSIIVPNRVRGTACWACG